MNVNDIDIDRETKDKMNRVKSIGNGATSEFFIREMINYNSIPF